MSDPRGVPVYSVINLTDAAIAHAARDAARVHSTHRNREDAEAAAAALQLEHPEDEIGVRVMFVPPGEDFWFGE